MEERGGQRSIRIADAAFLRRFNFATAGKFIYVPVRDDMEDSGRKTKLTAKIVSSADDFVICSKASTDQAMAQMRQMMHRLNLTVIEAKTHIR